MRSKQEESVGQPVRGAPVLAEIGRIIGSSLDINEVYGRFADEVRKLLPFDRLSIATVDLESGTLTHAHVVGVAVPGWGPGDILPLAESVNERSVLSRKGHLLQQDPQGLAQRAYDAQRLALEAGLRSGLTLPLLSRGTVVGTLNLRSKQADAYTEQNLKLAERVAAQIAGAIANSELHLSVQRDAKERAILAEIGRTISSTLDIDEVYGAFSELVAQLITADRIVVTVADRELPVLHYAYTWGQDVPGRGQGDEYPVPGTLTEEVMRTRSPVLVQMKDIDPLLERFPGLLHHLDSGRLSFIIVPLVSRDQVIAALHIRATRPDAFTEPDLDLAERIGAQIAGAVHNAQLHAQLQVEANERETLANIGRIISSTLDIDDVYERFACEVGKLIPFDRLGIGIPDAAQEYITMAYMSGFQVVGGRKRGDRSALAGTLTQQVVQSMSTILIQDVTREHLEVHVPGLVSNFDNGLRSFLNVPLIHQNRLVGVLSIRSRQVSAYSETSVRLAERVGIQIAGAVANSVLYAQLQDAESEQRRLAEEQAVLAEIGRIITSSSSIDEVYQSCAEKIRQLIPCDRVAINLIDFDGNMWTSPYVSGTDLADQELRRSMPLEGTFTAAAVKNRLTISLDEAPELETQYPGLAAGLSAGLKSFLGVPLRSRDKIIGALILDSVDPDAYDDSSLDLAQRVADQMSGAIANAQLRATVRQAAHESEVLAKVSRAVSSSTDLNQVLDVYGRAVGEIIPVDTAGIGLIDHESQTVTPRFLTVNSEIAIRPRDGRVAFPLEGSISAEVLDKGSTVLVQYEDPIQLGERFPQLLEAYQAGIRSFLAVPVMARDQVTAVIHFSATDPDAYGPNEVTFAEKVASQISGAVAIARLYERLEEESTERETLATIGRIIASTLDINEIYRRLAEELRKLIAFDRISIMTADLEADTLTRAHVAGTDVPGWSAGGVFSLSGSDNEPAIRAKKGHLLERDSKWLAPGERRAQALALGAGLRSGMMIPLISNGQVIGTFNLRSKEPNAYGPKDLELAQRVGAQVAGAIANAQLYAAQRRAERELRMAHSHLEVRVIERTTALRQAEEEAKRLAEHNAATAEAGRIMSSSLDVDEVYERFAEHVGTLVAFDRIAIVMIDAEQGTYTAAYVSGIDVPARRRGHQTPLKGTVAEEVLRTRSGLLIQGANTEELMERFPRFPIVPPSNLLSYIAVPLVTRDEVIGVLAIQSAKENAYREDDLQIVERLGTQIAGAIANAQLHQAQIEAQEAVRESERQYRRLVELSPDAIVVTDGQSIVYTNTAGADLLGAASANDVIGGMLADFFPLEYHHLVSERMRQVLDEGRETPVVEMKLLRLDGRTIEVEAAGAPIIYHGEKAVQIIARDITDRKEAEEALAYQARLVEDVSDAIIASDERFVTTAWNGAAEEMYGWTAEDVIGKPTVEFLQPEFVDVEPEEVFRRLLEEGHFEGEVIHARKDGTRIHTEARALALRDKDGSITGFVSIDRDITERRRNEETSRDLAVMEERNRLAREIHDTLAQSLTGLVLRLGTASETLNGQTEARAELDSAGRLAQQALEEARRSVWDLRPRALESTSLTEAIRTEVSRACVPALFEVRGSEPPSMDSRQELCVLRIAQEAISNLCRHADAKTAVVKLVYGQTDVQLQVSDDGVGFEPSGKPTQRAGNGFGLSSMQERARLAGGLLQVTSAPGVGTEIDAIIPYQPLAEAAQSLGKTPTAKVAVELVASDPIKVLVVDDHEVVRQGIATMLRRTDGVALAGEACDGEEALSMIEELDPDVVLLDVQMPRLDGVQTLKRLRELGSETRVILLTTYAKDEYIFDGLKAGARGYLLKDVAREDLVEAIRTVHAGDSMLPPVIAGRLISRLDTAEASPLTERELEVLRLVESGARNKDIAEQLTLSVRTVRFHIENIYQKLAVQTRTQAVRVATERHLLGD